MSSRRQIPCRIVGQAVIVGWDNPLSTFFAQVFLDAGIAGDDPRDCVLWVGASRWEISTPDALATALAGHADLTPDIISQLRDDRLADLDRGPTPLQRFGLGMLRP